VGREAPSVHVGHAAGGANVADEPPSSPYARLLTAAMMVTLSAQTDPRKPL